MILCIFFSLLSLFSFSVVSLSFVLNWVNRLYAHTAACKMFEEHNSFDMRRFILSGYTNNRFRILFLFLGYIVTFFTRNVFNESRFFLITIRNAYSFECQYKNTTKIQTNATTKQLINWKIRSILCIYFEWAPLFTDPHHFGFRFHSNFHFGH